MGLWAWLLLLATAAVLATAAQQGLFADDREADDHDWIYIASGGLIGGFTGHLWYPGFGPLVDGLNVVPAVTGLLIGAAIVESIYRVILRPRQV